MKMLLVALGAGLLVLVAAPLICGAVVSAAWLGTGPTGIAIFGAGLVDPGDASADTGTADGIPVAMLDIYQAAASVCPGLSWTTLAAIGSVESDNDQSTLPGVHSGHNFAGAEGPMQFEPSTFVRYDVPVPPGGATPPSPYDPVDAVYAAARMLCADGAAQGEDLAGAIYAYNHSVAYVNKVLQEAGRLQKAADSGGVAGTSTATGPATVAVEFALAQLGTPYRWGGEAPGVAFDCSGLVQAAWGAAGVHLPRVAQQQFAAGPLLPPGTPLQPGDLVFFGPPDGGVTHVGMVTNSAGEMVDAPHPGAFVRLEPFPVTVGARWGGDIYVGATRPGSD